MSTTVPPHNLLPASSKKLPQLGDAGWLPPVILGLVVLFNGAGLLLVGRRLAGALTAQLPLWQVFVTALTATVLAKYARLAWRQQVPRPIAARPPWLDRLVGWGTSSWLVFLALGCSYPGYRNGEWLTWLPMLIADQFWRQNFFDNGRPGADLDIALAPTDETEELDGVQLGQPPTVASDLPAWSSEQPGGSWDESCEESCEEYVQQVFRVREAGGQEVVYAAVRADFLAGQRHATVHVGFCPPLPAPPHVEAAACHWPDAQVRVTQALPHGVRLDVRLGEPAEEACGVPIDLSATPSQPDASEAARVVGI